MKKGIFSNTYIQRVTENSTVYLLLQMSKAQFIKYNGYYGQNACVPWKLPLWRCLEVGPLGVDQVMRGDPSWMVLAPLQRRPQRALSSFHHWRTQRGDGHPWTKLSPQHFLISRLCEITVCFLTFCGGFINRSPNVLRWGWWNYARQVAR